MDRIEKTRVRGNYLWSLILALSFVLLGSYTWAGSSGDAARSIVTDAQRGNLQELFANVPDNQSARVIFNKKNGTPSLIKVKSFTPTPRTVQRQELELGQIESTARQFLAENRALLKIDDPDQELNMIKNWADQQGATHFKYQQMVGDVPVFGKQLIVHVDGNHSVYLLNGQFEPTSTEISTTPTVTENEAIEAVNRHLGRVDLSPTQIELSVFTKPDGEMVLTYKLEVAPSLSEAWTYFIDAGDAGFVHRITRVYYEIAPADGVDLNGENQPFNAWHHTDDNYYLIDPSMPGPEENIDNNLDYVNNLQFPGNTYVYTANNEAVELDEADLISTSSPSGPWDPAGVSAMVNIRRVHQYYHNTFNHNGWDDNYANINILVNYDTPHSAFFRKGSISSYSFIALGDGDGNAGSNVAADLQVIGHEFQHGVTEYTVGLIYEHQGAALDEAYSEIFSFTVVGNWPEWPDSEQCPAEQCPTKMSEYRQDLPSTGADAYRGAHVNKYIPMYAGYLMAEELDNSIGREATVRIWYRALTTYLTSDSEFGDARVATVQSAEDLYGPDSTEVAVVRTAWDRVEVSDDTTTPTDNQNNNGGGGGCLISTLDSHTFNGKTVLSFLLFGFLLIGFTKRVAKETFQN